MKQIPNIVTLLNLFCGCIAILFTLQNGIAIVESPDGTAQMMALPEQIWLASLFIGIAAVVDFFDGFVARLIGASSEMGKQLDSLADVVSFGVAPGMIIYQLLRLSVAKSDDGLDTSILWLMPAFVLPCAAAYRLAKFNLDTRQSYSFRGTPVPSVGLTVAAFPLIYWHSNHEWVLNLLLNKWFLYAVVAAMSWLMISDIPIMSNKFKEKTLNTNIPKLLFLLIAILGGVLLGWLSVPLIFVAFVLLSVIFKKQIQ
ncbi:MAG: CDP-alcohol phosphatidyltransferase family protein [Chitinophagaceae bacterium]